MQWSSTRCNAVGSYVLVRALYVWHEVQFDRLLLKFAYCIWLLVQKCLSDCPDLSSKILLKTPYRGTRHNELLCIPNVCSNYERSSYAWRTSSFLNELTDSVDFDLFNAETWATEMTMSNLFFNHWPNILLFILFFNVILLLFFFNFYFKSNFIYLCMLFSFNDWHLRIVIYF